MPLHSGQGISENPALERTLLHVRFEYYPCRGLGVSTTPPRLFVSCPDEHPINVWDIDRP